MAAAAEQQGLSGVVSEEGTALLLALAAPAAVSRTFQPSACLHCNRTISALQCANSQRACAQACAGRWA